MGISKEYLNLVLSLKVSWQRQQQGLSLAELAQKSGLSLSYLNDIERGRKYPMADKVLQLAQALEMSYDDLISLKLTGKLAPLSKLLNSSAIQEIPTDLFGFNRADLVQLMTGAPDRFALFTDSIIKVAKKRGVLVDDFMKAAIQSYKELHLLDFPEIKKAADEFRQFARLSIPVSEMAYVLQSRFDLSVMISDLTSHPGLNHLNALYIPQKKPVIYINRKLDEAHIKFLMARFAGYEILKLQERLSHEVFASEATFDQLRNFAKATLFAHEWALDPVDFHPQAAKLLKNPEMETDEILNLLLKESILPETLITRLAVYCIHQLRINHISTQNLRLNLKKNDLQIAEELHFHDSDTLTTEQTGHICRRLMPDDLPDQNRNQFSVSFRKNMLLPSHKNVWTISIWQRDQLSPDFFDGYLLYLWDDELTRQKIPVTHNYIGSITEIGNTCETCPAENCQVRVAAPRSLMKQEAFNALKVSVERLFVEANA